MSKKLIALCACPMGLAHTFMAAQALEEAAVEAGYEVKIETQGADGIQNRLTAQDIAEATIIIHSVAVTPEDNERFESRDVIYLNAFILLIGRSVPKAEVGVPDAL